MDPADFHYDLPEELIAQRPLAKRGASRLLALDGKSGTFTDRRFRDLEALLSPGDLLVLNDTRVIPARLFGRKSTGGRVEILVERVEGEDRALAHVRSSKPLRGDAAVELEHGGKARLEGRRGELFELRFELDRTLLDYLETHGHVPLPPYIRREDESDDRERYQTVYADNPGAVAAPTAGLHFDRDMLERIAARGVCIARITLHVGAGTFQPVRAGRVEDHVMHAERVTVDGASVGAIRETRDRGGRVVAVGTTVVRALEAAAAGGELVPYRGETRLFINPGFRFRVVDALITNFHLPRSTLLMLVCAFAGKDNVLAAYDHAVAERYRFFSYGDAMFLTRGSEP